MARAYKAEELKDNRPTPGTTSPPHPSQKTSLKNLREGSRTLKVALAEHSDAHTTLHTFFKERLQENKKRMNEPRPTPA